MSVKRERPFRQQFLELLTGSTVAQVFSLLLMPVISRLYSPGEMGEYAIYVAISSIAGSLSTLRLDVAVVLADTEDEGSHLVYLGCCSALVGGVLALAGLVFYGFDATFAAMTAISVATIGAYQCLINWHSRKRNYKILASRSAGEKLVVLVTGIALGWWGYTRGGLIVAQTLGLLFSLIYLAALSELPAWKSGLGLWSTTLGKFSDFLGKNTLSSILISLSTFLPSILFAAYFDKALLGQYNLASRIFEVPINLIGYTFSTVYYQYNSKIAPSERLRLFWKTLRWLAALFVPAFALVAFLAPRLFGFVFGEVWHEAGVLSQWLAPVTCLRLFYISQASLLLVGRRLSLDLILSVSLFAAQVGGFFLGLWYFDTILGCIQVMSLLGVGVYIFGLFSIRRALKEAVV